MPTQLETIIKQEHKEFIHRTADMEFFMQSYEGGRRYINASHIFRHQREDSQDFTNRLARANFFNYCQPVIDLPLGHIYDRPINRTGDEEIEEFLKDVDRRGNDIRQFLKTEVALNMLIFGHSFVLVTKPRPKEPDLTHADEISNGTTQPYFASIDPRAVFNWSLDSFGGFDWLRYKEEITRSEWNQESTTITRYWTWTKQEWIIHEQEEKGELVAKPELSGTHGLGLVPIVEFINRRSRRWQVMGLSSLENIAATNRSIANLSSLIDEFNYRQAFNMLALPIDGMPVDDESEEREVGTNQVVYYNSESGVPMYISPPTEPVKWMMEWKKELVTEIQRMATQQRVDENTEQSGISKQWDFHQTNQMLADIADSLENGENQIWDIRSKMLNAQEVISASYPNEFDVKGFMQEMEEALQVEEVAISPTFTAEHMKKTVRRVDDKLTDDQLIEIDNEIDRKATAQAQADDFEMSESNAS